MPQTEAIKPIDFQALGLLLQDARVNYRDVMLACGCSTPVAYAVLNGEWNPKDPRHSMVIGLIQLAQKHDIAIPHKEAAAHG